jgi:hypothetical protein
MRLLCLVIIGLLSSAGQAGGSILLEYDFNGETGAQTSTIPSWSAAGLAASDFHRGFGLEAIAIADSIASRAWTSGEVEKDLDYFEFAVTPTGGATLDLDQIAFGERRNATGIRAFVLRSSLDGFLANLAAPTEVPDDGEVRGHVLALGASFDAISTPVTFRLYGYFSEAFVGRWAVVNHPDLGAFRVSGTVSRADAGPPKALHSPEPPAALIWGLVAVWGAGAAVFGRQRRKLSGMA